MRDTDPNDTAYQLCVNDTHVANLLSPRWEDMFWYSYRIKPLGETEESIVRDEGVWRDVAFTLRDRNGLVLTNPTFSGGYSDFCNRITDRLTFRSLAPPERQHERIPLGLIVRIYDRIRQLIGLRILSNEERLIAKIASQRQLTRTTKNDRWYSLICEINRFDGRKPLYRYKCIDGVPCLWDRNWDTHLPAPICSVEWLDIATTENNQLETICKLLNASKFCYDVVDGIIRIHGYTPRSLEQIEQPSENNISK